MDVMAGGKQTEIGVIPEDWQVRPLLGTVKVANGQVDPRIEPYRSMILVAPDHIESGTGRLLSRQTANEQRAISGKYFFHKGDLVYSKIRPYLRKAIVANFDGLCSADMYPLKPMNGVCAGFMLAVLLGHRFSKYAESVSVRSGMPKINRVELAEYLVALPNLAEQERIAEALRDMDALIESLEQLIAKKRLVKQGTIQELLTGKRRLQGFANPPEHYLKTEVGVIPGDWRLDPVEKIAHITTGSRNTQDRVADGEYPFFVRSQTVERINSYSFDGEAVLTAGDGVGTGKVFHYINCKFDLHQRVYCISDFSAHVSGYFFYLYFSSRFYNRIMQMTAKSSVDSVRREMIAKMWIPLPPTKAEQEAIAKTVRDMDAEIVALETKLVKARQIKQGMMQNLLTGKIRLL